MVALLCLWYWIHWHTIRRLINSGFTLYTFVWCLAMSLLNIARLLTLYYFWNHVGFYDVDKGKEKQQEHEVAMEVVTRDRIQSAYLVGSGFRQTEYHALTKQFSLRMRIILYLAVTILVILSIGNTVFACIDPDFVFDGLTVFDFIQTWLSKYIYNVPSFLIQFVLSIQYCRGCVFVMSLNDILEKSVNYNVNWKELSDEYTRFHHEFKKSIKLLEIIIICIIAARLCFVWTDISAITAAESWIRGIYSSLWLIVGLLPFIELVFAGNATTANFHAFRTKLYQIGAADGAELSTEYLYFLSYVNRYPFLIQIFAKEISWKNAVKVTAAFAVAKTVSYLFKVHAI